ncbi:hypothetical protein Tco_1137666, partial [Tanacetum coccineum]
NAGALFKRRISVSSQFQMSRLLDHFQTVSFRVDGCGSLLGSLPFCTEVDWFQWLVARNSNGAGKDMVGFLKTVSRMNSGLFEVLPVSKWKWNVCVVPSSSFNDGDNLQGSLPAISTKSSLHSLVKELA